MDDEKNSFGGRARIDYLRLRPLWRRYHWQIIIIVLAVFLLFFLLRPQLPSLPGKTEAVVCQSSSTDSWRGWHLRSGWKQLNGVLLNDGSNGSHNGRPTLGPPAPRPPKTAQHVADAKNLRRPSQ